MEGFRGLCPGKDSSKGGSFFCYLDKKEAKELADEIREGREISHKYRSIIILNGNNGHMKKRPKEALIYHHEFDPHVYPEKYYFSLLLLFKPWRKESDLKGTCKTYQDAFQQSLRDLPQMKIYDNRKQKIIKSQNKVEDKV